MFHSRRLDTLETSNQLRVESTQRQLIFSLPICTTSPSQSLTRNPQLLDMEPGRKEASQFNFNTPIGGLDHFRYRREPSIDRVPARRFCIIFMSISRYMATCI
jgi:hypothetical protein